MCSDQDHQGVMSPLMRGNGVVYWSGVLGRHAGTTLARSLSTFGASTTLPLGQATGDIVAISHNHSIYSALKMHFTPFSTYACFDACASFYKAPSSEFIIIITSEGRKWNTMVQLRTLVSNSTPARPDSTYHTRETRYLKASIRKLRHTSSSKKPQHQSRLKFISNCRDQHSG